MTGKTLNQQFQIILLSSMVENALVESVSALQECDMEEIGDYAKISARINLVSEGISNPCFLNTSYDMKRAADRVTNICERTIYVETGKLDGVAFASLRLPN
jgi:phosphate uptake regulator